MPGYIGNIPVPQAVQIRGSITATAGQTSFSTSGFQPGYLDVYLNGVKLIRVDDYLDSNGSDIILTTAAEDGDVLEYVAFSTFEVARLSAGATGGGSDQIFYENDQQITADYTIGPDKNAMTTGPVEITSGATVTVEDGSRWVIL